MTNIMFPLFFLSMSAYILVWKEFRGSTMLLIIYYISHKASRKAISKQWPQIISDLSFVALQYVAGKNWNPIFFFLVIQIIQKNHNRKPWKVIGIMLQIKYKPTIHKYFMSQCSTGQCFKKVMRI